MKTRDKIISGMVVIGITTAGVAGLITPDISKCLDRDGVEVKSPIEELVINTEIVGRIVEANRICFKTKADYETLRNDRIGKYKIKEGEERLKWLLSDEGKELDDILTHEIQKKGTIQIPSVKEGDDIFQIIINKLQL